jgi:hypothetical protein
MHRKLKISFSPEFSKKLPINGASGKLARFGSFVSGFGSLKMR